MATTYDLDTVRGELPVLHDWIYLNTGTVGIMAEPVLKAHLDYLAHYERGGHTAQHVAVESYNHSKLKLAELLGVDPADIAFNRNATDGINAVAAGFPLQPGDEIITSTEEHPAMVIPWLAACDRNGARMRFMPISADSDQFVANLLAQFTPQTRVVTISQVSCETGVRLPVDLIRGIVGPDVAILIDASQSVGQFEVKIPKLNADFVIGNGHKWLAGPKGTGFVWFKPESIHLAPPVYFHSETVDPHWSRDYYQSDPLPAIKVSGKAERFEFGTRSWHLFGALANAIEYQATLGWPAIENHMRTMSNHAKESLAEIPGVRVLSPGEWEDSSGLVTFSIAGMKGELASQRLWDGYKIAQRRVASPSSVRVACAYFTSAEDIQCLVEAVDSLARHG